jgi:hypothetical protein
MTAAFATAPKPRRRRVVSDEEYVDTVVGALRARLREVSAAGAEPLETLLGSVSLLADRVVAVVPARSALGDAVGPVYRQAGLARACGCSRQAVSEWVKHRRVLALTTSDGVVVVPAGQLDANLRPLRGLADVLRVLTADVVDDWMLASWLTTPQATLRNRSVLEWLAAGSSLPQALAVAEAARRRWMP